MRLDPTCSAASSVGLSPDPPLGDLGLLLLLGDDGDGGAGDDLDELGDWGDLRRWILAEEEGCPLG